MERKPFEKELRKFLEPKIQAEGLELVAVEFRGGSRRGNMKIFLDNPNTEGGVGLSELESMSRSIGALLDVENLVKGSYALEVSSPGIDRPLIKLQDFVRFKGERIRLRTVVPVNGGRNFKGLLVDVDEDARSIRLETELGEISLDLDQLDKANLEYDLDKKKQ